MISIRDNENNWWKRKRKNIDKKSIVKKWELNDFAVHLKVGFVQLMCEASLILKSNLKLTLSIILKGREFDEFIVFDLIVNPSFKMTTNFGRNYTITWSYLTHLVNTFYNNYIINICPTELLWFK